MLTGRSTPFRPDVDFLDTLFGNGFSMFQCERHGAQLIENIVAGGYPAALMRPTPRRLINWYRNYTKALVQRDVRDISRVRSLNVLPRLLRAAAAKTAQLFNLTELASPFEFSRPSIRDYVRFSRGPSCWNGSRVVMAIDRSGPSRIRSCSSPTPVSRNPAQYRHQSAQKDRTLQGHFLETFVYQEL